MQPQPAATAHRAQPAGPEALGAGCAALLPSCDAARHGHGPPCARIRGRASLAGARCQPAARGHGPPRFGSLPALTATRPPPRAARMAALSRLCSALVHAAPRRRSGRGERKSLGNCSSAVWPQQSGFVRGSALRVGAGRPRAAQPGEAHGAGELRGAFCYTDSN